jgi:hypothetical protein
MTTTPEVIDEFAPEPEPAPMGELARLVNVFVSPGKAFADIARRPTWLVPILLTIIATTALLYLFSERVGFDQLFRQQAAQNPQLQNMDAAQRARAEQIQAVLAKYIAWVSGVTTPILGALVASGILKFLADTVMGAGIGFKKTFAAVSYAWLPMVLQSLLSILVLYMKPPEEFDLQNPVMVNAALFLSSDAAPWLKSLASSFDLFSFWTMALMAIGLAAGARRLTTGKAFGMILFPWALGVILKVGGAAFRSA